MMRVLFNHLLVVLTAVLIYATSALGQGYPSRPVKLIVGYAAGGGSDSAARTLGQKLTQILGQSFVSENKPGASGTLAAAYVATSPPDGYTLLLGDTGQLVVAPNIIKGLPYDTIQDLTPVSRFYLSAGILIVSNATTSIKTLDDLVREARASPGRLSYGSSGIGSIHHIFMELFKASAGLDIVHIPYKGAGQSASAILSGEVPLLMVSGAVTSIWPYVKSGKINLLAVASNSRLVSYPDVPALSEFIKDFDFATDFGILAPAGLSPEVLTRLSRAIRQATESQDFIDKFKESGGTIEYASPDEYADSIRRKLKRYEQAIKRTNMQR